MTDNIRILIVEDHYVTLDGLMAGLAQEPGFEILGGCSRSDEGLAAAGEKRPDVILIDLHLPGPYKPTELVSKFLQASPAKLIIFSAEMRMAYVSTILSMGVSAYLLKSERINKVAQVIREVMQGQRGLVSEEITSDSRRITPSENEVLHLLGKGMKYQEIADLRGTSIATARKQTEILLAKLELQNREQLIAWAVQNGYGGQDVAMDD
jgi:DNA-binding NarL/FixJ family response regulator